MDVGIGQKLYEAQRELIRKATWDCTLPPWDQLTDDSKTHWNAMATEFEREVPDELH